MKKSLFEIDIEVGQEFAATEEWHRLCNDSIARDVYLSIGSCHLRGPEFYEDAFRFAAHVREDHRPCQHCGKPPVIEATKDLLDALGRACSDPAMREPWKPMSRIGYGWSNPNTDPMIRADEMDRELRLRELLEMIRGGLLEEGDGPKIPVRHVKWHYAPPPPEPEPILFFEI